MASFMLCDFLTSVNKDIAGLTPDFIIWFLKVGRSVSLSVGPPPRHPQLSSRRVPICPQGIKSKVAHPLKNTPGPRSGGALPAQSAFWVSESYPVLERAEGKHREPRPMARTPLLFKGLHERLWFWTDGLVD